jgi:tRNA (guanine37-N1)-methyltransferase
MEVNKNVNSVFEKKGEISGKYRLRDLNLLYGDKNTETTYRENKCYFKLDVKNTFFSPRLVYERKRVASSNIKENETIIDLFAGVGPFSIQIAKNHNVEIYSFDLNPDAYHYLIKNIEFNNLRGKIHAYNLDVKTLLNPVSELGKKLKNSADRIIMNLPEISLHFLDVTCYLMKKTGGIIHYYHFSEKPNPIQKAIEVLSINIAKKNWKIEKILKSKIVKAYSPKSDLIVLDLVIKSLMN